MAAAGASPAPMRVVLCLFPGINWSRLLQCYSIEAAHANELAQLIAPGGKWPLSKAWSRATSSCRTGCCSGLLKPMEPLTMPVQIPALVPDERET